MGQVPLPGARKARVYRRPVDDGTLTVMVANEPNGWHLSISHATARPSIPTRYPTWDEITDARYRLAPPNIDMVMHLPPPEEYVALHPTVFHLHQHPPV